MAERMANDMSADPDNDETFSVASTNSTLKDPPIGLAIVREKENTDPSTPITQSTIVSCKGNDTAPVAADNNGLTRYKNLGGVCVDIDIGELLVQSPGLRRFSDENFDKSKKYNGYDSDGHNGPWLYMVREEGVQDHDENILPTTKPEKPVDSTILPPPPLVDPSTTESTFKHVPIDTSVLMKLKNGDLKTELIFRGQTVSVNQNALWERMQKALAGEIPVGFEKEKTKTKAADGVENISVG